VVILGLIHNVMCALECYMLMKLRRGGQAFGATDLTFERFDDDDTRIREALEGGEGKGDDGDEGGGLMRAEEGEEEEVAEGEEEGEDGKEMLGQLRSLGSEGEEEKAATVSVDEEDLDDEEVHIDLHDEIATGRQQIRDSGSADDDNDGVVEEAAG
jgi:hypothetical protein